MCEFSICNYGIFQIDGVRKCSSPNCQRSKSHQSAITHWFIISHSGPRFRPSWVRRIIEWTQSLTCSVADIEWRWLEPCSIPLGNRLIWKYHFVVWSHRGIPSIKSEDQAKSQLTIISNLATWQPKRPTTRHLHTFIHLSLFSNILCEFSKRATSICYKSA